MINQDVQRRVDAYRGNPGALMKRYQMTQELLDLLALQKLKSEKEAAAREMAMAMQQGGEPPTVAQQREQEVTQMTKQELAQQLGGLAQLAQQRQRPPMMSGVATAPGADNVMPPQAMAAGGIVAFQSGGMPPSTALEMLTAQPEEREAPATKAEIDRMTLTELQRYNRTGEVPARLREAARAPETPQAADADLEAAFAPSGARMPPRTQEAAPTPAAEPSEDQIDKLLKRALKTQEPKRFGGGLGALPAVRTAAQIQQELGIGVGAQGQPVGTQQQQDMFKKLRELRDSAETMTPPGISDENRRAREEAIRRAEQQRAEEFDPERQRIRALRDFLLGGAGRRGLGSIMAGAGIAASQGMSAAEAAARARDKEIEAMRETERARGETAAEKAFLAKQKGVETALSAERALLELSVRMSEGDKDRGVRLASLAQELASRENLTRAELAARIQMEADRLGVTLSVADANRLVDIAKVQAQREATEAQRESTEQSRREALDVRRDAARTQVYSAMNKSLEDVRERFDKERRENMMLNTLLSKFESGEALKPEQAALVQSYQNRRKAAENAVRRDYAPALLGGDAFKKLIEDARQERARRQPE